MLLVALFLGFWERSASRQRMACEELGKWSDRVTWEFAEPSFFVRWIPVAMRRGSAHWFMRVESISCTSNSPYSGPLSREMIAAADITPYLRSMRLSNFCFPAEGSQRGRRTPPISEKGNLGDTGDTGFFWRVVASWIWNFHSEN